MTHLYVVKVERKTNVQYNNHRKAQGNFKLCLFANCVFFSLYFAILLVFCYDLKSGNN